MGQKYWNRDTETTVHRDTRTHISFQFSSLYFPLLTPQQHMGYRGLVDPAMKVYATQKILASKTASPFSPTWLMHP